eukprot:COSAG06_NODE_250_length_19080_cov_6.483029_13_plen_131_part_00
MLARLEWYVSAAGGGMVEPQQWTPPYQARPLVLSLSLSFLVLVLSCLALSCICSTAAANFCFRVLASSLRLLFDSCVLCVCVVCMCVCVCVCDRALITSVRTAPSIRAARVPARLGCRGWMVTLARSDLN